MKRIIHKIRLQPPEFRMMVAVIAALVVTGVIGVLWAITFTRSTVQASNAPAAPSPLSALVGTIRGTVETANPNPSQDQNAVQVINAGTQTVDQNPDSDSDADTDTDIQSQDDATQSQYDDATQSNDSGDASSPDDSNTPLDFSQ